MTTKRGDRSAGFRVEAKCLRCGTWGEPAVLPCDVVTGADVKLELTCAVCAKELPPNFADLGG